jgi:hypothetical protein
MKNWTQFLAEQSGSRWKYNGTPAYGDNGNSQITSPRSIDPTMQAKVNSSQDTLPNPDSLEGPAPVPQGGPDNRNVDAKIRWLDNMVQIMNAKRLHQMELNSKTDKRLGRLEKAIKLPPPINNGNSNGMMW